MQSFTWEEIELIVEKKLNGTITPEEQVFLDQWLCREPGKHMIWNSNDTDERAFRERLLRRIKKSAGIPHHAPVVKRIPVLRRYKWAVVAAILLLITGGMGYLLFSERGTAPVGIVGNEGREQDIPPGHHGAILTLSNGNQIILDSVANGNIPVQGNSRLIKKNGQLLYETGRRDASPRKETSAYANSYNTMTTPRGREFQLILSDGTKVWLNAMSSITYPTAFTGKERKVTITGEVYFEVAEDSRHPFIVSVDKSRIIVLGTHFDVMAYSDEERIKTTLLQGAVKVSRGDQEVVIEPGQQASFSTNSDHIRVTQVEAGQAVAWVDGKLSLDDLEIEAIMRKVSRWYNVDVEFKGSVPQRHFWGVINREVGLLDMLKVMQASGINARLKDKKIIVSGN